MPLILQKKLESVLSEKPEEGAAAAAGAGAATNGSASGFDREAYLREVEQFEDVEVVVAGRNSVRLDRKHVSRLKEDIWKDKMDERERRFGHFRSVLRSCTCTTSSAGRRTT